jgi:hypothetical protein
VATTEGRMAVFVDDDNAFEWATPVLYLNRGDGKIFDISPAPAPALPPVPPPPSSAPPPPATPAPTRSPSSAPAPRPRWRRIAVAAAIAIVAAIAVFVFVRTSSSDERSEPTTVSTDAASVILPSAATAVGVPANEPFTDTGIDLRAGQSVTIDATGTIQSSPDPATAAGPDGDPNPGLRQFSVIPANHAALIARVGSGDLFFVGAHLSFVPAFPGRLMLGINDLDVSTNSGNFEAQITVQ